MSSCVVANPDRSLEKIDDADLAKLCEIALKDSRNFVSRYPKYKARIIGIALCQGSALHYVDGRNGVKDFDLWTFYDKNTAAPTFPVRRHGICDFGPSKFDRAEEAGFTGRRVDLFGRSIEKISDPVSSIQAYLQNARTMTAVKLSRKAVVLLYPAHLRGRVIWPVQER